MACVKEARCSAFRLVRDMIADAKGLISEGRIALRPEASVLGRY